MPMNAGHQTQPYCSPYSLCDLPLVDRSQTSQLRVFYSAHLGHIFRHHCKILLPISFPSLALFPADLTLYSFIGLTPSTSKASLCGVVRPYFHFFCSAPLKSCGLYTSPGLHLRYICFVKSSILANASTSSSRFFVVVSDSRPIRTAESF